MDIFRRTLLDFQTSEEDLSRTCEDVSPGPQEYEDSLELPSNPKILIPRKPSVPSNHKSRVKSVVERANKMDTAATKIQATVRGRQTRKHVIFPSQLEMHLSQALAEAQLDGQHVKQFSQVIAREILQSSKTELAGHGKRIIAQRGQEYVFQHPQTPGEQGPVLQERFQCPVDVWIKKTQSQIEVELVGPPIAQGHSKTVHHGSIFIIDLTPEHVQTNRPTAVVRFDGNDITPENIGHQLQGIRYIQERFSADEIKKLRLAGIVEATDRSLGDIVEARDEKLLGSLYKTAESLTFEQKRQVFRDVANALDFLHSRGLVHGDVKPENILVSLDREHGHLADLDGVRLAGQNVDSYTYDFADQTTRHLGLALPFTDIYALALSLEETFQDIPDHPYKLAINSVKSANRQLLRYLEQYPSVVKALRAPYENAAVIREIYQRFPAYGRLLHKLISS